jgi:hypothetical protein
MHSLASLGFAYRIQVINLLAEMSMFSARLTCHVDKYSVS